jgi:chaperonin GroEL (HSP60 family)
VIHHQTLVKSNAKIATARLIALSERVLDGQFVLSEYASQFLTKHEDHNIQMLVEVILEHSAQSERMSPGSSRMFLLTLQKSLNTDVLPELFSSFTTNRANRTDIENVIAGVSDNPVIASLVTTAFSLCGKNGSISVSRSNNNRLSVELSDGHLFNTRPAFPVNTGVTEPRIACVDGAIESVAELNYFLTELSESKDACVLFARSYHVDVVNTLKVNLELGRLNVYPVSVPLEAEELNTMVDISTLCGSRLLSTLSGDTVNSLRVSDTGVIGKAFLTNHSVTLSGTTHSDRVKILVKSLRERSQKEEHDFKKKMLSDRAIRLMTDHVIIRVNTEMQQDCIDRSIRAVNAVLRYGVNENNHRPDVISVANKMARQCYETLTNIGAQISC